MFVCMYDCTIVCMHVFVPGYIYVCVYVSRPDSLRGVLLLYAALYACIYASVCVCNLCMFGCTAGLCSYAWLYA